MILNLGQALHFLGVLEDALGHRGEALLDGRVLLQAISASEKVGRVLAHLEAFILGQTVASQGGAATLAAGVLHVLHWRTVLLVKS